VDTRQQKTNFLQNRIRGRPTMNQSECVKLHEHANIIGKLILIVQELDTESAKELIKLIQEVKEKPSIKAGLH